MPLPPLEPISNSHFCKSGDVTIAVGAAIAPGAILQADSDSRIIINAGVCIGMGAILHAHQGTLEVETGATLGAGVLVVGKGKIGANACIGSAATIWNSSVDPGQVIPSGSLLGDTSRQISEPQQKTPTGEEPLNGRVANSPSALGESSSGDSEPDIPSASPVPDATLSSPAMESPASVSVSVYGQANLKRLLGTLFPYNQSFKSPDQEDKAE